MIRKILPLIALFIITSCGSEDPIIVDPVRQFSDVLDDFEALSQTSGIHDASLEFLAGKIWNFRYIVPANVDSGSSFPLIFDLHGASGGNPDVHKNTGCYLEEAFEGREAFFIVPNGGTELWNSFSNQEMVINLLMMAKIGWAVDETKIAVTGFSNGGNGSWFFGETQPTLFSAAIPMASSYTTIATNGSVRVMPIPMYCIHGENDELFPLAETQDWVDQTNAAGSDVTFVVAPGLTHNEPCSYTAHLKDGVDWLFDTIWN